VVLNPFISDGDLRAWAQTEQLDPDRLNMAIEPLKQVGKLADMGRWRRGHADSRPIRAEAVRARQAPGGQQDRRAGGRHEGEKMAAFRGRMP
jgi:hypothetical protein